MEKGIKIGINEYLYWRNQNITVIHKSKIIKTWK